MTNTASTTPTSPALLRGVLLSTYAVDATGSLASRVPHLSGEPVLDLASGALVVGDVVRGVVGVEGLTERLGKKGPFWTFKARNMTGVVEAKAWGEHAALFADLRDGQIVVIEAKVGKAFNDEFSLALELSSLRVLAVDETTITFWDLVNPRFAGDLGQLHADAEALVQSLRPSVRALYDAVIAVAGREAYEDAPGAPGIGHHGYIHGLLEHSVEVAQGVDAQCQWTRYRGRVDRDFAVMAALLHDVGKVQEYAWTDGPVRRATRGRLGTHLSFGSELVAVAAAIHATALAAAGVDALMVAHLQHVCVSHHMEMAKGSPVAPASIEAMLVAVQDGASSHVASIADAVAADRSADVDGFSQGTVTFYKKGILHPQPVA